MGMVLFLNDLTIHYIKVNICSFDKARLYDTPISDRKPTVFKFLQYEIAFLESRYPDLHGYPPWPTFTWKFGGQGASSNNLPSWDIRPYWG